MSETNTRPIPVYETLSLQGSVDEEWRAAVTEAYGQGDCRVVLETSYYLRQNKHHSLWDFTALPDAEELGGYIDGTIVGAELIPQANIDDDGEERFVNQPFAIMSDAVRLSRYETDPPTQITMPGEHILVPILFVGSRITLYHAAG